MAFSLWIDNKNDSYLHVSEFFLKFDFGEYPLQPVSGMIAPRKTMYVGNLRLQLPQEAVGSKIFSFRYKMQEYINNVWVNLREYNTETNNFISVYPSPFYNVFLSRGLRTEDKVVGNPIAEMIREWGFTTTTVGIEVDVAENDIADAVRAEIQKADALVAIATPRYLDSLTGLWKTLEWAHDEIGIAFGINKPLLILKEKGVALTGLPSYLATYNKTPMLEFDPYGLHDLRVKLSALMPSFRDWIETKRRQQFNENLKNVVVGGLAFIGGVALLSGIVGALTDSSDK